MKDELVLLKRCCVDEDGNVIKNITQVVQLREGVVVLTSEGNIYSNVDLGE